MLRRDPFEVLLGPRSVVVVGASNTPYKYGHLVVQSLTEGGFPGELHLVNVNRETILGRRSWATVSEIPGEVEAAVIVVPADHVPESLRQCGEKGVRLAVVISGGFNELAAGEGDRLYTEMRAVAARYGIRIIGPNTFGTFTPAGRFNASFSPDFSRALPGRIALVSQSGGVAHIMAYQALREKLGLRCVVGVGNRANVEFHDLVRFFGADGETAVIGLYLEGVDQPRELLQAVKEVAPKKPVLAFKTGRVPEVALPARSHTGSLSGRFELYRDGLRQAGVLWMASPQELMDAARLFSRPHALPGSGSRVAIMSIQAGAAIMLADLCAASGLTLAAFSGETRARLRRVLPAKTFLDNPVDMGFSWLPPVFIEVIRALVADPGVDVLIVYALAVPGPMTEMLKLVFREAGPFSACGKQVFFCTDVPTFSLLEDLAGIEEAGVAVYLSPERLVRAVCHRVEYERLRGRPARADESVPGS
jgi:acyl-CoA synthetase (NDP forming)